MPWWQLSLQSSKQDLDATEAILLQLGAQSLSIRDAGDEPLYEPLPGEQPLWSLSIVTALFDHQQDLESIHSALARQLPPQQAASISHELLEDQEWERVYLERYQPIRFGKRLWACPSWVQPPDPAAINIILDPGIAFGTGSHPTTALCLEFLEDNPPAGLTVMDFGCGSGILAIAAALLGAAHLSCVDIDPQALTATRENLQRNAIDDSRVDILLPDRVMPAAVDYLIANILSGPLIALLPRFVSLTHPGSQLVLSGILEDQADNVVQAYSQYFILDAVTIKDQWCRVTGIRKSPGEP